MRFAYADPPYPGMARRYYGSPEVNHEILIGTLVSDFPDGWALSTSAGTVRQVLSMCPASTRVACWVRGSRKGQTWRPRNAWEPLLVFCGRPRRLGADEDLDDVLLWGGRQHSHPDALIGMKSAAFAEWMFRQLGALSGDTLIDVFPGSGVIGRAWDLYAVPTRQLSPAPAVQPYSSGTRHVSPESCLAGAVRRLQERLDPDQGEPEPAW